MIDLTKTLIAIKADVKVSIVNNDINKITWHDGNPTNITNDEILAKQAELQVEYDANQYQRDRTKKPQDGGYPFIEDQMDMQYHDLIDGTTTWKDAVKAIKDTYPKP